MFDRQIGLIEAPRAELIRRLLEVAEPMPGLRAFFTELQARGGESAIVSAGIREAIEAFWEREQLPPMELFASELVGEGPDGGPPYHLEFSDALGDCPRCGPRSCKAAILRRLRRPGDVVLVFGDGPSDVCPAREADLVFARGHLAERCAAGGTRVAPAHRLRRRCSARSTRGWRAGERERGRRPARRAAGASARPARREPSRRCSRRSRGRRARRRCSSSPRSPSRRVAWAFLIWLLRDRRPLVLRLLRRLGHRTVYLDYAQKVAAGPARLQGLLVRVPAAGAAAVHAAAARRPGGRTRTGSPPR